MSINHLIEKVFVSAIENFGMARREGQIQMAKIVANTLEKKIHVSAVEAGTGVGKSLGYLLSVYALSPKKTGRVVISTGTKNLQQRLYEEDAPLAAQITGVDLPVAVIKGRGNYLCIEALLSEIRREQDARAERGLKDPSPKEKFFEALKEMLQNGEWSGEFEDLSCMPDFSSYEIKSWFSDVSAVSDYAECKGCVWVECPFYRARERASFARVIIANHHLVAADFALRRDAGFSLFSRTDPPTVLIVDEAHDFPEAFRSVFEARFTLRRWLRLSSDSLRLVKTLAMLNEISFNKMYLEYGEEYDDEYNEGRKRKKPFIDLNSVVSGDPPEASVLKVKGGKVDDALQNLFAVYDEKFNKLKEQNEDAAQMLLFPEEMGNEERKLAETAYNALSEYCEEAVTTAQRLLGDLESSAFDEKILSQMSKRVNVLANRCGKIKKDFERTVLLKNHYRFVGSQGDACSYDGKAFVAQPVDLGDKLKKLWDIYYCDGVVLTSATLFPRPKESGYEWFRSEFGMPDDAVLETVPSPFCYDEQMDVLVFSNEELLPSSSERVGALVKVILRAIEKQLEGGILVLFTSFGEMRKVAEKLAPLIPGDRLLLVQGQDGSRTRILQQFKEHGKGILLGVDSFWQGIDVPGEALSTVIITKLPFPVPDDPIVEAKTWLVGKRDGWQKVCKPLCALKLQQGAGRLIRTETDKGMVLLCDPRALKKHKQFLRVFPTTPKMAVLGGTSA